MRELVKKTIDGNEYEFEQMAPKLALKTLVKLSKIVGKPIAMVMGSDGITKDKSKGILSKNLSPELFSAAVGSMIEKLDEADTIELCVLLTADTVLCDGKKIDFNSHYASRLGLMFKVLAAALEVQFGNFFDDLFVVAK